MTPASHYPVGQHILSPPWVPTEQADVGLIWIPGHTHPIVLEWRGYRRPGQPWLEYMGAFSYGAQKLSVKERYEYMWVDERGTFRKRFRTSGNTRACCTEIIQVLSAGGELSVQVVEHGAYEGMWRCDIHRARARPAPGIATEETACRAVFNLLRNSVLLFRWRYVERV